MNNKIPKDSVLKKKGFYAALYSCVGIMLIIAAVMSFNNYSQAKKLQQESQVNLGQLEDVSKSNVRSYLTPQDRGNSESAAEKATPAPAPTTAPAATAKPETSQSGSGMRQATPAETAKPQESAAPKEAPKQAAPPATQTQSEAVTDKPTENQSVILAEPTDAPPEMNVGMETESGPLTVEENYLTADPVETKPVFNEFAEGKYMNWPLIGEIVMDFSSDRMIYDKTLDQYRTNYSICISSELGSQVRAATDGVVKEISKSVEKGNSVTIDNGNGWETTYSQLQDGILVSEGDVVKAGQVIGGVSSPSIYGVLLGNHLEFAVAKDGVPVNPKNILSNN